jgi:hypothetical protein
MASRSSFCACVRLSSLGGTSRGYGRLPAGTIAALRCVVTGFAFVFAFVAIFVLAAFLVFAGFAFVGFAFPVDLLLVVGMARVPLGYEPVWQDRNLTRWRAPC